jgi:hypothetical protein
MGSSVKVNFGPHFVYQPRKLPMGLKLQLLLNPCKPPVSVKDAIVKVNTERPFRKPEMQQKFLELVEAEVRTLQDAYQAHRKRHVLDVMEERKQRKMMNSSPIK